MIELNNGKCSGWDLYDFARSQRVTTSGTTSTTLRDPNVVPRLLPSGSRVLEFEGMPVGNKYVLHKTSSIKAGTYKGVMHWKTNNGLRWCVAFAIYRGATIMQRAGVYCYVYDAGVSSGQGGSEMWTITYLRLPSYSAEYISDNYDWAAVDFSCKDDRCYENR